MTSTNAPVEEPLQSKARKISALTEAVQNAATDEEAKRSWQELEKILFGIDIRTLVL